MVYICTKYSQGSSNNRGKNENVVIKYTCLIVF